MLGAVSEPPFHGMRLKFVGTGIRPSGCTSTATATCSTSVARRGLYAVGSCAALTTTGSGYNSGIALGRGLTLAYLAAGERGGAPVP